MTADGLAFGIVVSRWNEFITRALLEGALDALKRQGAEEARITVAWVPGSFEIPVAAQAMAQSGRYDAIIALGCVIRGATTHYDHIASGVLTVESIEQGIERAGSKAGNKGAEAALVAIEMANLLKQLKG